MMHVGIAGDALHVAERLLHGLAERDADILGGVVIIDMQVALGLDRDVHAGMPGQQVQHVVEKADAGLDLRAAGAVEGDLDRDVGFLGFALDLGFAHDSSRSGVNCGPCIRGRWRVPPLPAADLQTP